MKKYLLILILCLVVIPLAFAEENGVVLKVSTDKAEYVSGETVVVTVDMAPQGKEALFYVADVSISSDDKGSVLSFVPGGKVAVQNGVFANFKVHDVNTLFKNGQGVFYGWKLYEVYNGDANGNPISLKVNKPLGSFKALVLPGTGTKKVTLSVYPTSIVNTYSGFDEIPLKVVSVPVTITIKSSGVSSVVTAVDTSSSSLSSSSSSSGSGGGCVPQWSCGSWRLCDATGKQSRSCTDVGVQCTQKTVKTETQSCVCQESWSCGLWSSCVNGKNMRTCVDDRKCGTVVHKPVESKGCGEVIGEYVPPVEMGQLPGESGGVQEQSIPAVEQTPKQSFFDTYKLWFVGGLFVLMLIITVVFTIYHHILGGNRGEGGSGSQVVEGGEGK